ncbi:DNA-binding transcriptional regulator, MarR family [Herbiconiux ginsengi]|uniref:DNA-binding transcriptional regulator, MarR family n=2 Tax=Herbiconiux ginsengi TaxID=381665 RepID=A0A1H3SZZ8_9MICO|nr:DNA-binding transcriptional regulator, MarR family [Herbiconiux ginsengi]
MVPMVDDTPWLAPDEADAWIQMLAVVEFLPTVIDQQLKRDSGVGRFDYSILAMLSTAENRTLTMLDLSVVTFGSLSRLSHTVSRLCERGLVERERIGGNRYISLTDAGWKLLVAAAPGHVVEVRRQVFDHITPEDARELARILRPVADHLRSSAPRS